MWPAAQDELPELAAGRVPAVAACSGTEAAILAPGLRRHVAATPRAGGADVHGACPASGTLWRPVRTERRPIKDTPGPMTRHAAAKTDRAPQGHDHGHREGVDVAHRGHHFWCWGRGVARAVCTYVTLPSFTQFVVALRFCATVRTVTQVRGGPWRICALRCGAVVSPVYRGPPCRAAHAPAPDRTGAHEPERTHARHSSARTSP